MPHRLAQINIARLIAAIDDPKIAGFVAELDSINALADVAPGFIWRLKSDSGNATDIAYDDDPFIIVNMSVWDSPESLRAFTYQSRHVEIFRQRAQWFEKPAQPTYCLWWVPDGHIPTLDEARERLEHYRRYGPTQHAFWFQHLFPMPIAEQVGA